MNVKTRRGVYYSVSDSDICYKLHDYTFYFSSEFNLKRFEENLTDHVSQIDRYKHKILNMFINSHVIIKDPTITAAVDLYKKIEKRGYYITDPGGNILCQETEIIVRNPTKRL